MKTHVTIPDQFLFPLARSAVDVIHEVSELEHHMTHVVRFLGRQVRLSLDLEGKQRSNCRRVMHPQHTTFKLYERIVITYVRSEFLERRDHP